MQPALSSISQIAHVEIVTRTSAEVTGHKMSFDLGRPSSGITALAANVGTIVTARDLFYNYKQRKDSLQSPQQEYNLIHEVVCLYALNNLSVAFTLTKVGAEPDLAASAGLSLTDRIRVVIGPRVGQNLRNVTCANPNLKYKATGVFGDLSSCLKTYRFVFFVNGRLVDCQPLKKSLETVYRNFLPKGSCAFVMLSLTIACENVDVNIHPTKKEVRFLYEDQIVGEITAELERILSQSKQTDLTPRNMTPAKSMAITSVKSMDMDVSSVRSAGKTISPRQNTLIREDHTSQRIDDSFRRQEARNKVGDAIVTRKFKLESLIELKAAVITNCDQKLRTIFAQSCLIGCPNANTPLALVQFQEYLLQVDLTSVTNELFYWLTFCQFGNMAEMIADPPISLVEMLGIGIKQQGNQTALSKEEFDGTLSQIRKRSAMLYDYFSMQIDDNDFIVTFPSLIDGYIPDWNKLPEFVYDLAFNVNWTKEKPCFETFGRALAKFYAVTLENVDRDSVSSLIYPAIKQRLRPSSNLQSAICNLSSVPTLFRAFERC